MKRYILLACALALMLPLLMGNSGCSDADIASENISKAADNFEIMRRVVFYNGITGEYILSMEGLCSLGTFDTAQHSNLYDSALETNTKLLYSKQCMSVTCKTGPKEYKKHFLGLSDNVTFFAEQMESAKVSAYHYRVIFKPQTILPDIDFRGSTTDRPKTDSND